MIQARKGMPMNTRTLPTVWNPVNVRNAALRRPIWGGKVGGRHYKVFRALVSKVPSGVEYPLVTISQVDLGLYCNISSHSGLARSIEYLVKKKLIEIVDRGIADQHTSGRKRGRAATYLIRQEGCPERVSDDLLPPLPVVKEEHYEGSPGAPPLPNVDMEEDHFVEEPHLIRWLDMMDVARRNAIEISATILAKHLGLSVSGAWEMLERWKKRGWVRHGKFWASLVHGYSSKTRFKKMAVTVMRAVAVRAAALRGEYVPKRMRIHQRMQTTWCGMWRVLDFEAAAAVAKRQAEKAELGLVPWLEECDYARVA